jgi:hypothetical protein|tara:strand:+ start:246 stop:359 length:114 start_codon:yes stop_codon:yes gene_type:complete
MVGIAERLRLPRFRVKSVKSLLAREGRRLQIEIAEWA